jgi:uncharacterized membrane protein YfcA
MDVFDILFLCAAGFLAGALNAVAGGGTIFTFSALLAIGMPPVLANATSASAVVVGSIASMLAYRAELVPILRRTLPLCLVSVTGAAVGAALLLVSGDRVFGSLVPWLIFLATALFAVGPYLIRRLEKSGRRFDLLALPLQGAVAVYGGYFGAGVGVMMLATLVLTFRGGYHEANAAKNLLSIVIQLASVAIFLALGLVDGKFALAIAASSVLGGWIGVRASKAIPVSYVRRFVILTGVCLGGWTLVR